MDAQVRTGLSADARGALVGWLPHSEFALSLRDEGESSVTVTDDDAVEAVAVSVRGRPTFSGAPLLIACAGTEEPGPVVHPQVVDRLVEAIDVLATGTDQVEVVGPATLGRSVAEGLAARTGGTAEEVITERLMVADAVVAATAHGIGRPARSADLPVLAAWFDAFWVEAIGAPEHGIDHWLKRLSEADWHQWVWERDGQLVSLVNHRRTTPVSSRVGPVYTPPDLRGNGYAGALTAAVTEQLLADGDPRVTLFTDAANATSNALYARLGFRDVGEHGSWSVTTGSDGHAVST